MNASEFLSAQLENTSSLTQCDPHHKSRRPFIQANETFEALLPLREDLALALRAAAHQGLSEGVCNHFSVAVPGRDHWFLLNPRGLHWSEVQAADIVMCNAAGEQLAGRHPVEPTAMFIHAPVHRIARKSVVLHTHMPHATALTLTAARALDTTLSQTAMRFHGRLAVDAHYNGLALSMSERIAHAMQGVDVVFLGNYGVIACGGTNQRRATSVGAFFRQFAADDGLRQGPFSERFKIVQPVGFHHVHVGGWTARHADHPCGNAFQRSWRARNSDRKAALLFHPPAQRGGVHGCIPQRQKFWSGRRDCNRTPGHLQ